VYTEPRDLDQAALLGALDRHWRIRAGGLDYLPVGFGSHHWEAVGADGSRWFVSADDVRAGHHAGLTPDDAFALLDRAFRTAAALRDEAGLEFVLAPVLSLDGAPLHRLDRRYTVRVEPFVEGDVGEAGEFAHPGERRRVGELLGRLHAASGTVAPGLPGWEGFGLPGRAALEAALAAPDMRWDSGPFAEPAAELLRLHAGRLRDRLRVYDRRVGRALDDRTRWVVTHGEPHGSNVIRDAAGGVWLVDWDTTLVGPPERDLWMVLDADLAGWDEYRAVTGADRLDEELLGLYRERWALAEIGIYVAEFRAPHEETADTRASWAELREYLS
jgi:spectinomycin phosphotransferase